MVHVIIKPRVMLSSLVALLGTLSCMFDITPIVWVIGTERSKDDITSHALFGKLLYCSHRFFIDLDPFSLDFHFN